MHFVLLNIGWENQTVVSERFEPGKYYIYIYIYVLRSENRYNSGIVLRKVGILTLSGEVGILTLRRAIPELLVRKVGIETK